MNNIFTDFVIGKQLFVTEDNWSDIVKNNSQEFIIQQISDAIVEFDIELPYRDISIDDANSDYLALSNLDTSSLKGEEPWGTKFDYKYGFNSHYINLSNVGNKASDYFHQVERWKCDATGYPSPQKTWENERFRLTLFKALFSLKVKKINPQVLRNIISLRKYIAAQFRPSAAKYIYDYFQAENVLDLSAGWGDRILGAHTSKYVKRYVGFDPNLNLIKGYLEQISYYQNISTPKKFSIFPWCAEDPNVPLNEMFDLIFTSPPYFDKEKYDQSEEQSYKKHKSFDSWMNDFLFKTIELRSHNLKSGGHLVINISDIYSRKKLFQICDGMNDYITSTGLYEYQGAIGLRMPKRPMSKSSGTVGVYAEPIWVYRKL
ncbi:MAG: DNA methyltransferase [Bacteroidales bacterium]|nr:DNA methyltransferase [Bacteroidales bacterium]